MAEKRNLPLFSAFRKIGLSKNFPAFFLCLIFSAFLWLFLALSKDYTSTLHLPVRYLKYSSESVISNNPPSYIEIDVQAPGYKLAEYQLNIRIDTIDIDILDLRKKSNSNQYFLLTNSKLDRIEAQFGPSVKILKVIPDTIFFNFEKRVSKKIPVIPDIELAYEKQFGINGEISINPDSITVTGGHSIVDTLKAVYLERREFTRLDEPLKKLIRIKTEMLPATIDFSDTLVELYVPVEKFTEGNFLIAPEIINIPDEYTMRLFPEKIKVTFLVALSNYEKIHPEMIRLMVDFKETNAKPQKISVMKGDHPGIIKIISTEPSKVEYIIRKK